MIIGPRSLEVPISPFVPICRTPFTRRPVPDGLTVSFCNRCFATVAESHWEAELDAAEQAHECDPKLLEYWQRMTEQSPSKKSGRTGKT